MGILDFGSLPLWQNAAIFLAAAVVIWFAGARLSRYADAISGRTGLGRAFIGVLLLGGITSLPELATTVSASLIGNAALAVNNILGGVAMQVTILVVADAMLREQAATGAVDDPVVLLQAALGILALLLAAAGMVLGESDVLGAGLWTTAIFLFVLTGLYLIKRVGAEPRWAPAAGAMERRAAPAGNPSPGARDARGSDGDGPARRRGRPRRLSAAALTTRTVGVGLVILVAGFVLARSGDTLAEQTGLGSSFVGAVLVAIATSLPEISTTLEAVRLGLPKMAFSNILGTNLFDVALLFVADVVYRQGPVLDEMGRFSQFAALLGAALTAIYLTGLLVRRERTVGRLGLDSLLVLACYAAGAYVLYTLR